MSGTTRRVWLVKWLNDSGEAVIHAADTRNEAVDWVKRSYWTELYNPANETNNARIYSLPLNRNWSGSHHGLRSIEYVRGKLLVTDVDGKVIEEVSVPPQPQPESRLTPARSKLRVLGPTDGD